MAILCGAYLAVGATIALSGSAFPILGTGVDQGFRVAQVEHFIHTLALTDYAYRGLPAFYPPLYFWLLGRIGALTQAPAYQVVKLGALLVAFAVPLVTAWFWSKITPRRAFVIAVVRATVIVPNLYEPHEWLALVIFVPWWLSFVLHTGRAEPLSRTRPRDRRPDRRGARGLLLLLALGRDRAVRRAFGAAPHHTPPFLRGAAGVATSERDRAGRRRV